MLVVGTVLVAGCTGDRIEQTAPAQPTVRTPVATHTLVTTSAAAVTVGSSSSVTVTVIKSVEVFPLPSVTV